LTTLMPGDRVRCRRAGLRETGVTGTVRSFDAETRWCWVEWDRGPPWRGQYDLDELMMIGHVGA
jgi:hypothetical protein